MVSAPIRIRCVGPIKASQLSRLSGYYDSAPTYLDKKRLWWIWKYINLHISSRWITAGVGRAMRVPNTTVLAYHCRFLNFHYPFIHARRFRSLLTDNVIENFAQKETRLLCHKQTNQSTQQKHNISNSVRSQLDPSPELFFSGTNKLASRTAKVYSPSDNRYYLPK